MTELQSVSFDEIKHLVSSRAIEGETMVLNMGPQHPSTHGVLRLLLELDGETIINVIPDVGFLHTGIEKNMEAKTYLKAEVMSDRLDYMNTTGNNLVYVLAVEKLVDLDVPPRAQSIRVIIAELQRIASHLVWLARRRWTGSYVHVPVLLPRARDDPRYPRNVLGPAHDDHLLPARRPVARHASGVRVSRAERAQDHAQAHRRVRIAAHQEPALHRPHGRDWKDLGRGRAGVGSDRRHPAGFRTEPRLSQVCPYSGYEQYEFECRWRRPATAMPATWCASKRCASRCGS
jgi:hypothetical protein